MRMLVVALLAFLLLSPLIKTTRQRLQKPLIFIAQDASFSVAFKNNSFDTVSYQKDLKDLVVNLAKDYDVKVLNFSDEINSGFDFRHLGKQTDISQVLNKITSEYANSNIGALILATDGVFNKGANPNTLLSETHYPVYTVALGDTIAKKDLILMQPNYNELVYLGDGHQVEVVVKAYGAKGATTQLKVATNDGQINQQAISFAKNEETKIVKVTLDANKKGIQKISLSLIPLQNEVSTQNNNQIIYVEVLDGREKILLVADAPHPDLGAIKQGIENNKNYEVTLAFADNIPQKTTDFGLVILHNLPSKTHAVSSLLSSIKQKNKWFIVGAQTNTSNLNNDQNLIDFGTSNQTQSYTANINDDFYAFSLSDESKIRLQNLAPLIAPFTNYRLKSAGYIFFKQQIGSVKSNVPLFVFGEQASAKTAILIGEGIWRWRMDDFEKNNNFDAFNELITKSVQYLNAKDDKRKLRVKSNKNRYFENEQILLTAELYNDTYELLNEPEVSLEMISSVGKKYSYVFSRVGNSYSLDIGILPAGEYDFTAKTKLGNNSFSAGGTFLVEALNNELKESKADHQLLYNISQTTGAQMLFPKQIGSLVSQIRENEKIKTISYQEKDYDFLINLKWLFALVVLLLSFEWFLRKRNGAI